MSDPVFDPEYWRDRVAEACVREEIHRSVFNGSKDKFEQVTKKHREFLSQIKPNDSILDLGCGYGRLLQLLPGHEGEYLGIDISPDLISIAKRLHGESVNRKFMVGDVRTFITGKYDWAVAIGLKNMIVHHVSSQAWDEIENRLGKFWSKGLIIISLP